MIVFSIRPSDRRGRLRPVLEAWSRGAATVT
jgi:hypothetical protein